MHGTISDIFSTNGQVQENASLKRAWDWICHWSYFSQVSGGS